MTYIQLIQPLSKQSGVTESIGIITHFSLPLPSRGLGRSLSRNRIWCILWHWEPIGEISCIR